ncbi:MAG TPA: hypothetical protein VKR58_01440, partial [Aquella sp.]|nr:hypothetical protein [Aquella sp.]
MSVIQIYYAWVLRQFSQLNELFLPAEVIVFITSLCKPKFRFIEEGSSRRCNNREQRLDISQNRISGYFKSKPDFCHRRMLKKTDLTDLTDLTDSTDIHNDAILKKFFLQNNILGIKDNIKCYGMIMILTACNRVIICKTTYIVKLDAEDKNNLQYDLIEGGIKILNFPFEVNKIKYVLCFGFAHCDFIELRSTSGTFYCFVSGPFEKNYFENHKPLIESPIRNIKKMIFF